MIKNINIKIINKQIFQRFPILPVPKRLTAGSAGLDLFACINSPLILLPTETYLISTGIAIHIDDIKIAGIILPRSGLGHNHGIILGNSVGLIDSDYQGELFVSLWNRGKQNFLLNPGKRIAQLLFIPIISVNFTTVSEFIPSDRGNKGFGHSM